MKKRVLLIIGLIVLIAGVIISLMGTLCTTVSACVDSAEKIRNIKEVK